MADTAISALSAATTLAGTEPFPVVQSGTKKSTIAAIGTYIGSLFGLVKNNLAASTNPSATDDTGSGYSAGSLWFNSTLGVLWVARSVGASAAVWMRLGAPADFSGYLSGGYWYPSVPNGSVANGATFATNSIRLVPFLIREKVTISDLGCRITAAAGSAGSGKLQLAIYAMDMATKKPTGNALTSTPDIVTDATGNVNSGAALTGGNKVLEPGWYFFAINLNSVAGSTATFSYIATASNLGGGIMGSTSQDNISSGQATGGYFWSITNPSSYGTWPDLTGLSFVAGLNSTTFHGHFKTA